MSLAPADIAKRAAAARALEMVDDGMTLGLGTGSTAGWFVRLLSERIRSPGLDVVGVATSSATVWLAEELGVPLRKPDEVDRIDLVVDGADEIDPAFNLIKGGGAALLQEKIVATSSDRMVVIADDTKYRAALGGFPLPVEVIRFGAAAHRARHRRGARARWTSTAAASSCAPARTARSSPTRATTSSTSTSNASAIPPPSPRR